MQNDYTSDNFVNHHSDRARDGDSDHANDDDSDDDSGDDDSDDDSDDDMYDRKLVGPGSHSLPQRLTGHNQPLYCRVENYSWR